RDPGLRSHRVLEARRQDVGDHGVRDRAGARVVQGVVERVTDLRRRDAEIRVRAVRVAGEGLVDPEGRAQDVDRRAVLVVVEDVVALVAWRRRGDVRDVVDQAVGAVDVGALTRGRGRRGQGDRDALARIQVAEVAGQGG